ncbi:tetratricopeptide repeat protein [Candidatus Pacearchaeota archaeon]|nr:tetratricopeptide repeat protein [Candidatus Pacearchaeota archaeon]
MIYSELCEKADEKFSSGRFEEVRNLIQEGLSRAKERDDKSYIEFFLGELDNLNENQESAIFHLEEAVRLDPKNPLFLRNLGITYSLSGNTEKAIDLFNKALEIKTDDYQSLREKGVVLGKLGKVSEAIQLFNKALDIKHDDYQSLRFKGVALSKLGDEKEAIRLFDEALRIIPDGYQSFRTKGVALSKLGDEKEAIKMFDKALDIKPDDFQSLREKGLSLSKLEEEKEAINFFDKALEIKPDDWDTCISKANTFEHFNKKEEAKKIFKLLHEKIDKIQDEEIINLINFKIEFFEKKETEKPSDILYELIIAFQEKEDNFFKSMGKIENSYKLFINNERSIPEGFPSFLSILRKWNSYTPILPSEKGDNKGGGYFLYHSGKGIVIDPGFNFIDNFYQEGFKVADIDAVLITHAHNDHTVDLESILTLINELNKLNKKNIEDSVREEMKDKRENEIKNEMENRIKEQQKRIDLFLNVGTFMKYSGWLKLKDSEEINNVTVLQPNTTYKLTKDYNGITIHTTKAKHDEVIDNKYAIGFILDIEGVNKVGFTGDTGWDWENDGSIVEPFDKHKPKLVVAHLGSIKRKEFKYIKATNDEEKNECFYENHLGLLGIGKFLDKVEPNLSIISEFGEELRRFRKEIAHGIGKVLELNCLPGDIGLHIRLKDLGIFCFLEGKFVDYTKIRTFYKEGDPNISFYNQDIKDKIETEIFITAVEEKNRTRAISLSKRVADLSKIMIN